MFNNKKKIMKIKKSEKSEEKERDRTTEGETPNPIPGNWCTHWGWRAERKTEENKKKETGSGSPNPGTLEHSVASYDAQGPYDEPIIFISGPHGG